MKGVLAISACLLLAGCLTPHPADGALKCNHGSGPACPDGYFCDAPSDSCWRNGHSPTTGSDMTIVSDAGTDGGQVDLLSPPDLTPLKVNGTSCKDVGECASGFCVDGVCCDQACGGQCQTCGGATPGTCSQVTSGQPVGGRTACAGAGTACAGSCSTDPMKCNYPASGTGCGSACNGTCDGAGTCSATSGGACPNGFACGGASCKTSCANNADCQTNFACSTSNCVRVPESDCLDGIDNNGDGLADCADPTCNSQVECVPAVPVGDELGVQSSAACSGSYGNTEQLHQSLNAPITCAGCACTAESTCSVSIYADSSSLTCSTMSYLGNLTLTAPDDEVVDCKTGPCCLSVTSQSPKSIYVSTPTWQATTCQAGGTPSLTPPTWGASENFCGTQKTSSTCGASQVCVAKPPSQLCVRVPQPSASCPSGYSIGPATWYGSYQDQRQCGACSCAVTTNGDCGSGTGSGPDGIILMNNGACPGSMGTSTGNILTNTGASLCIHSGMSTIANWTNPITSFNLVQNSAQNATCSSNSTETGAAVGVNGSTICCR